MLAFIELPAYLTALDEESRRVGAQLAQALQDQLVAGKVAAGVDLTCTQAPSLVYIESGCLRWQDGSRLARLYNDGDWLAASPEGAGHEATVSSEFLTTVRTIARSVFNERLRSDPAAAELWDQYRQLQERILLGLAGVLAREELAPNTRIERFAAGEVIVTEGSAADEVFVLLEGSAAVQVEERSVGTISEGEVFGEMSFLTGQPRSASVVASVSCLVQVIARDQFAAMVKANPQLLLHVATTLANRVVDLNRKLQTAAAE